LNAFRTNFRAAFRDVAVTDSLRVSQFFDSILRIEWMHFQRCDMNQETWPDEFVVHLMVAQHVANVLAQKTFDAFPEFLNTINVLLLHPPCAIRRVRRSRLERFDLFLYPKIPRDIFDQILNQWKCFYWLNRYPLFQTPVPKSYHSLEFSNN